jgi:hypothetical protein
MTMTDLILASLTDEQFDWYQREIEKADQAATDEATAEIKRLRAELGAWRGCVQINAMMNGPRLKGVNRSELQRVFDKYWAKGGTND